MSHINMTQYLDGLLSADNASTNEASALRDKPATVRERMKASAAALCQHVTYKGDVTITGTTRDGWPEFSGDKGDAARQKFGRFWRNVDAKLAAMGCPDVIPRRAERSDKGTDRAAVPQRDKVLVAALKLSAADRRWLIKQLQSA